MHPRPWTVAAASVGVAAALLGVPACAKASPPQQVNTPRADASCAENLIGAMAVLEDAKTKVMCTAVGEWEVSTTPYPVSDRWLTYGPELRLRGQGMRNPEILSGRWTGYPQQPDAICAAEQVTVLGPGKVSTPEHLAGEPGEPLQFHVSPTLFDIKLNGPCLWQKI